MTVVVFIYQLHLLSLFDIFLFFKNISDGLIFLATMVSDMKKWIADEIAV